MSDLDFERFSDIPDPFAEVAAPTAPASPPPRAPSPTRSQVRLLRFAAAGAAILYDASWPLMIERRPDILSVSPAQMAWGLAIPIVAGTLAASTVGRSGDRGLGESKARILTLVIASPVLFAVATWLAAPSALEGDRFWRRAMGCALVTTTLAAGPLALALFSFRRAFAVASLWRTAALGVASGALAAATMSLVCPIGGAWHIVVGHGALMVVAGFVAALLGRRVCRA